MRPLPNSEIEDGEVLFRFCDPRAFPEGQSKIPTSIFEDRELSCDWQRFRPDPRTSFHVIEGKTRVISITVCDEIRNPKNPKRKGQIVPAWRQEIIYSPTSKEDDPTHGANDAHSLIKGKKKRPVCVALVDNSTWEDLA